MSWSNNLVGRSGGEKAYSWINYNDVKSSLTPAQIAMLGDRIVIMKPKKEIKKVDCECGKKVSIYYLEKHKLTQTHIEKMKGASTNRICRNCEKLKPLKNNFSLTSKKNAEKKTYRYICNKCRTEKNREYMKNYQKNKTIRKKANIKN